MTVPRVPAIVLAAALGLAFAACALPGPTAPGRPSSTAAPSAGPPWLDAAITQPADVTGWASQPPGYFCDPCHNLAEDDLFGVAATPAGLIAVGVVQPPARAIAFASSDGRAWTPIPTLTGGPGGAALAVASSDERTVIVGHDSRGATAWSSAGEAWAEAQAQASLLVPHAAGGMTSVVAFGGGFVAGGYRDDPEHAALAAAAWRSPDGLTWTADDPIAVFAGGRIQGLAASGSTIVAVGTGGDVIYGPAAAWRWTAATGWRRAELAPDAGGAMRAVVATPAGFVAVGLDAHDDGARVWTSADGLRWTAVPDQEAFRSFGQPVRMHSVALGPGGLVAGGWRSDPGKGSALTWASADGRQWSATWQVSFSGAQIDGVAILGGTGVAVGRTGYPDTNTAAIWIRAVP